MDATRTDLRRAALVAAALALLLALLPAALGAARAGAAARPGPQPSDGAAPDGANRWGCKPTARHPRPVVLVHGLGATAQENWAYLSPQLAAEGWCVFALTYGERADLPQVGGLLPMQQSAKELASFVDRVLAATGAGQVDLVGHSEGTVMPQWWLKKLGGAPKVHAYVAITPLYAGTTLHGVDALIDTLKLLSPEGAQPVSDAFDSGFCGSCQQFLNGSSFYEQLYSDGTVGAPGVQYTTLSTRTDELVTPYSSGHLVAPGAKNLVLQDLCPLDLSEHLLLAVDPVMVQVVRNALDPAHAQPIRCGPVVGLGLGPLQL